MLFRRPYGVTCTSRISRIHKQLYNNAHFMENIRAYNQIFSMTSLGAKLDESVNKGRRPYVLKVYRQGIDTDKV